MEFLLVVEVTFIVSLAIATFAVSIQESLSSSPTTP